MKLKCDRIVYKYKQKISLVFLNKCKKKTNKRFNNTRRQTINRFKLEIIENVRFSQLFYLSFHLAFLLQPKHPMQSSNKQKHFIDVFWERCAYTKCQCRNKMHHFLHLSQTFFASKLIRFMCLHTSDLPV